MRARITDIAIALAALLIVAVISPPAWTDQAQVPAATLQSTEVEPLCAVAAAPLEALPASPAPETALIDGINRVRILAGLSPLAYAGDEVRDIARRHSEHMLAGGELVHADDLGGSPGARLDRAGVSWHKVGENLLEDIGAPSPATAATHAVDAWIQSPAHRANLLDGGYTATAIGMASDSRRTYLTQILLAP